MATSDERIERVYKILLVGNSEVGKTSFVERYVNNRFLSQYKSTLGVDFLVKALQRPNGETIKLQLWDIQGQEWGQQFTRVYYKGAAACIAMFDLGNRKSFNDVQRWKKDLDEKVRVKGKSIPCLLLGNKSDCPDRCAKKEEIDQMSQNNGFINWIAISVKENKLVSQSMMRLVDILIAEDAGNDMGDGNENQCDGSLLNIKQDRHAGGQGTLQSCCANPQ